MALRTGILFLHVQIEDFVAVEVEPVAQGQLPDIEPVGFGEIAVELDAAPDVAADALGVFGLERQPDRLALEGETRLGPGSPIFLLEKVIIRVFR